MARDRKKRRQTEEELQKALQSLTNSQKLAKVGSWDWDIEAGEVEWSDEVYRIFGLKKDEFQPRIDSVMNRFHTDDRELHEALIQRAIENRNQYSFEARILLSDGSTRILLSTSEGYFDKSDNLVKISGTVQDITELKKAEEDLRNAKAYSEKLIESANAIIVVLDAKYQIKVFNRAAEEITGYTYQDALGCNWFELLVPEKRYPGIRRDFQELGQGMLPDSIEYPILTRGGVERIVSWRNTALVEEDNFAGSIFYGIDVTERKRLEKQLLQTQKMEAVGQLAGGIAHDFNNMLSVILGHTELIKSDLHPEHPLYKNVLEIERAGLHSRDITRQLLAFSRKQIISPVVVDLNDLINNIKKTLSQLIGENITLKFLPNKDIWSIKFDPTQIDQILINLAVNSRDAMPCGGMLTLETSNIHLSDDYCEMNTECRPGDYVMFAVSDNGIGMEKDMLAHVFEPFFTTKDIGRGTGLGLATVYGIIKQNGGFIRVYSELEKGTTFYIYIPRILEEGKGVERIKEAPLEAGTGDILLVEDDEMVRRMATAILERLGYSVVATETPVEAFALCEKEEIPIDLLITDVVMPYMNGAELNDKIKAIRPNVKVLFMSGYTENVIVRHGVLADDVHFLHKPFSMNDLAHKVWYAMKNEKKH